MPIQTKNKRFTSSKENIMQALEYLTQAISLRIKHSGHKQPSSAAEQSTLFSQQLDKLSYIDDHSKWSQLIKEKQPSIAEYIILACAISTEYTPYLFEQLLVKAELDAHTINRMANASQQNSVFFVPSIETALFIIAGDDLAFRLSILERLTQKHWLFTQGYLQALDQHKPRDQQALFMHPQFKQNLLYPSEQSGLLDAYSNPLPANVLNSELEWKDLVLTKKCEQRLLDLVTFVEKREKMSQQWGLKGKLTPGYRALFHGPSGTGKTLTAALLGKKTKRPVYRIDLSLLVSKYIGETEKNLAKLFDEATDKSWILFFDEADALFGKRTQVKDAHDKYANQEVSYLLQRIETFTGVSILASNFKTNIDEAFIRRFNTVIAFSLPSEIERKRLWMHNIPDKVNVKNKRKSLDVLAKYELSGGSIVNAMQYACMKAFAANSTELKLEDCLAGVALEFEKQNKVFQAPPTSK